MYSNLKARLTSLNYLIYFDTNDHLREKTEDKSKINELIIEALESLKNPIDKNEEYLIKGMLGNLYRIIENPTKAIYFLDWCLLYATTNNYITKEISTLIRLGEAMKYNSEHEEALNIFNRALEKSLSTDNKILLDFILQHKGKCLMELNKIDEAWDCLTKALIIREKKNDKELMSSTREALDYLSRLTSCI